MAIDKDIISPAEATLIKNVEFAEKRMERARQKLAAAEQEVGDATVWLAHNVKRLDDWRSSQPHQCNLPL